MIIPLENRDGKSEFFRSIRTISKISNWHHSEVWAYFNRHNCELCVIIIPRKKNGVGDWARIWLVDNDFLNKQKFTPLWNLSLFQRKEHWVVSDDNSTQKQGVDDWEGFFRSVNNNCLNNHQFTPLLSLISFQWIEMWVFPDDDSAQKQGQRIRRGFGQ